MLIFVRNANTSKFQFFSAAETPDFSNAPENISAWTIESEYDLADTDLTMAEYVAIYNDVTESNRGKWKTKRQAATALLNVLDVSNEYTSAGMFKVAGKVADRVPADDEPAPARATKGINSAPAPTASIRPCREGSKQATIIDALVNGATLAELQKLLPTWKPASIKAAIHWDIHKVKGYGIKTEGDVYTLILPAGMTTPIPHTPKKG